MKALPPDKYVLYYYGVYWNGSGWDAWENAAIYDLESVKVERRIVGTSVVEIHTTDKVNSLIHNTHMRCSKNLIWR